ncbi:MAG TPA: hypothetical protein VFD58_19990 [Blastocatellia bacterium]|nr:hypothetical protein [Blastocatellia bacterium]
MFRRCLCLLLISSLVSIVTVRPALADPQEEQKAQLARIKNSVARIGEGPDARVEVRLRDNTKLKGYIRESGEDYFIVRDPRAGKTTRVEYSQVAEVKAPRQFHVSPLVIRLAITAGTIAVIAGIAASRSSHESQPVIFSPK